MLGTLYTSARQLAMASILLLSLAFVVRSSYTAAQVVGLQMPQAGQSNTNYDEITTTNGTRCRQAMGSNWNVDAGVLDSQDGRSGGVVYGRVTYAIGAQKRIECSRLYELELESLRLEIELLRGDWVIEE